MHRIQWLLNESGCLSYLDMTRLCGVASTIRMLMKGARIDLQGAPQDGNIIKGLEFGTIAPLIDPEFWTITRVSIVNSVQVLHPRYFTHIHSMDIEYCRWLPQLTTTIQSLVLTNSRVSSLHGIEHTQLVSLMLDECNEITSLKNVPASLRYLGIVDCGAVQMQTLPTTVQLLQLSLCNQEWDSSLLLQLSSLQHLELSWMDFEPEHISSGLQILHLGTDVRTFSSMHLSNILAKRPGLTNFYWTDENSTYVNETLTIPYCLDVRLQVPTLQTVTCKSATFIRLHDCTNLTKLTVQDCPLKTILIEKCEKLYSVRTPANCDVCFSLLGFTEIQ